MSKVLLTLCGVVFSLVLLLSFNLFPALADTAPASITSGAAGKTTNAYSPNPINLSVGDTVIWTNNDSTVHTVTSGSGGNPDGKFDSSPNFNSLMTPQATFSHTFLEAGEFPYYCGLHPNMVGTVVVSAIIGFDPEFESDKQTYDVGDIVIVTIMDPDANGDAGAVDELIDIQVTSDSDQVGEEFNAFETGSDTGIFVLSFDTTPGTQNGEISVKNGDDITIRYTDKIPADQNGSKDFTFVIPVGPHTFSVSVTTDRGSYTTHDSILITGDVSELGDDLSEAATILDIRIEDVNANVVDFVGPGKQILLATDLQNNLGDDQPFIVFTEVRNSNDVTVFLAWQGGTLQSNGKYEGGLSWTPEIDDNYEVRSFLIDDFDDPTPLSKIGSYDIANDKFSIIGPTTVPVVLKILDPEGNNDRIDLMRINPDKSFEYRVNAGGLMNTQGNYEIVASYNGAKDSTFFSLEPLPTEDMTVKSYGETVNVKIETTSIINDVKFYPDDGRLQISLRGDPNVPGVLFATFPDYLLDDIYRVDFDNRENYPYSDDLSTELYNTVRIEYSHSDHETNIFGFSSKPMPTQSGYTVWYQWKICVEGLTPDDCEINKDHDAELHLDFERPNHGGHASIVQYSVNIEDLDPIRRPIATGHDIVLFDFKDLPRPESYPWSFHGTVELDRVDDDHDLSEMARISVLIVPEFPIIHPIAIATVLFAILLVITKTKIRMW